ncbi:hypothetical protein ABH15_01810 [Methanoculleus taiwanensis]|uniref:Uncharacterized protein n=1 Tax=Methanoculleus taiwanensis TaxID=1550565 RepID=A0A498H1S5_9EURY|nr:hypothetical protein [Methanoculleus taiwanensis]RXE56909.1 hypothetical protein ABH15_01810 [Methanoculleus taiwanensis]
MARTITVTKWESEQDVDNAVHTIRSEMAGGRGLSQETERAMQQSLRIADAHLTDSFLRAIREHIPEAMHYFEEHGGGS